MPKRSTLHKAIKAVILNELGIKRISTIGFEGLKELGLSDEYISIIKEQIDLENKKHPNERRAGLVLRKYQQKVNEQEQQKMNGTLASKKREIMQKEALGLPVLKRFHWTHIILKDEEESKVFILSSIGKESPLSKFFSLVNLKDKVHRQLSDFLIISQVGENGNGGILNAIIYMRWKDANDIFISSLLKEINELDKNAEWYLEGNKKTIKNKNPSTFTTKEIIDKIISKIRS